MSGPANEQLTAFAGVAAQPDVVADSGDVSQGIAHLAIQMAGAQCLLPLTELRGVLAEAPTLSRFPFGPPWLLGVFLFRSELLALVDPAPVVSGRWRSESDTGFQDAWRPLTSGEPQTVLVGAGERTLAFRVDAVSEVVFVPEGEDLRDATARAVLPDAIANRYIVGMWASDAYTPARPVLSVDRLLDDFLGLLAEEGRDG